LANNSKEKSKVILSLRRSRKTSGLPREINLPNSTFTYLITARKYNSQAGKVIVKTAPQERLENERDVLKHFRACPYVRQVLDETKNPPSLILQHLDDSLLHVSSVKTLESSDVKFVAKRVLQAIQALHKDGYTHTGMFTEILHATSYQISKL
jgi:serine/threonine protein kinase